MDLETRKELVIEMKSGGKSNREVAAALGVTEATVRADVKKVEETEPERIEELPALRTIGADGKSYPAKIEILCDRCKRKGKIRDCPQCKELKSQRQPGDEPKKPKKTKGTSGNVLFNWPEFDSNIGKVIRGIDDIGSKYNQTKTAEYRNAIEAMESLSKTVAAWRKILGA